LLLECGADSSTAISLAASIVDWRTPGSQARARGAKGPQYAAAGRNYAPPGAAFRSVAELRDVLGMTPHLVARLRPHLTVFTDTNPDRWSADAVVDAAVSSLNGARPPMSGNDTGAVMIVTIHVLAQGIGGGASSTEAVVRLNARPLGLPYEILAFQRPAD
jgi:general secretion pathway protein K